LLPARHLISACRVPENLNPSAPLRPPSETEQSMRPHSRPTAPQLVSCAAARGLSPCIACMGLESATPREWRRCRGQTYFDRLAYDTAYRWHLSASSRITAAKARHF